MKEFIVWSTYYDGQDATEEKLGVVSVKNIGSFVNHLRKCGFVGKMNRKSGSGAFHVTFDPGKYEHHGKHTWEVTISPYKAPPILSPKNWSDKIYPFEEHGYIKVGKGHYRDAD